MSYIADTLGDDEAVLAEARFHWTYMAGAYLEFAAWLLIATVVWLVFVDLGYGRGWAWWPIAGFGAVRLAAAAVRKWTTEIAVTDRRLVVKRGWVARRTQELPLNRIEEVKLRQGFLGRILDYGRLSISGTGGDKPIEIPRIDAPLAFRTGIGDARAAAT